MSAAAFAAMQSRSIVRVFEVGNCARSKALVPKAAMWTAAMRSASGSAAVVTLNFMVEKEEIRRVFAGEIAVVRNDRWVQSVGGVESANTAGQSTSERLSIYS